MNRRWLTLVLTGLMTVSLCGCAERTVEAPEETPNPVPSVARELGPEDWEAEYASCEVSGEETDYEVIARRLTEQYAQALRARPKNTNQSVRDAQPDPDLRGLVYDAYDGEEDPNFCFHMALRLDIEEEKVIHWQVGSDLEDPGADHAYPTYWGWRREAQAEKGPDGNWHLTGTATGGAYARLPVSFGHPGEHPDLETLMEAWFLTRGDSHDWRIPLFLDTESYPAEAVKAEIDKRPAEERAAWIEDMCSYMAQYGGSYTWTLADWDLTELDSEDGALFLAFLRGNSKAAVDEDYFDEIYDSGLADMEPFTIRELLQKLDENAEIAGELTYALMKTLGGREMLALHYTPFAAMGQQMYLVFGVFDAQVRLTYATAFGYRSYTELCQGLAFSGSGSSGAGDHPYWDGYIGETGHYQSLYRNGEDMSGGWAMGYAQIDEELYDESCELMLLEMEGTKYYQLGQWTEEEGPLAPALLTRIRERLDSEGMKETDSVDDLIANAYVAHGFPPKPEVYEGSWFSLELNE